MKVERAAGAAMWWHGDLLNFGASTYSGLASEVEGDGKYKNQTLYNSRWICERVPISRRRENLSFGHHEVVAPLPAAEQRKWLKKAEEEGLSVAKLRKATANARVAEEIENHPLSNGKYNLIYADALELLRAGDGWMQLMKDYGADTLAVNAVQRGRLYIQAKLGELMPASPPGRGKRKPPPRVSVLAGNPLPISARSPKPRPRLTTTSSPHRVTVSRWKLMQQKRVSVVSGG